MNVCSNCGKEFDYVPATSRADGSDICRVCAAQEAIDFLPAEEQAKVLDIVKAHENG